MRAKCPGDPDVESPSDLRLSWCLVNVETQQLKSVIYIRAKIVKLSQNYRNEPENDSVN